MANFGAEKPAQAAAPVGIWRSRAHHLMQLANDTLKGDRGSITYSYVGIVIALSLTLVGYYYTAQREYERGQEAFSAITEDTRKALDHRLTNYTTALHGAAALQMASDHVTQSKWSSYVSSLDIGRGLTGIKGVGYAEPVSAANVAEFLREAREDGVDLAAIHPASGHKDLYPIKYIAPLESNRQAVGLDLSFEEGRATALRQARSSGEPTITSTITLVQDRKQGTGFLLVLPIYAKNAPISFTNEREAALIGWTYLALVADDFLADLTPRQGRAFDLAIYQGHGRSGGKFIYSSKDGSSPARTPKYTQRAEIMVAGQPWTLQWTSLPEFENAQSSDQPLMVLLGGAVISLCLCALLLTVTRREASIRRKVNEATEELAARNVERLRMLYELREKNSMMLLTESVAHVGHWRLDLRTDEVYWSPETFAIHGITPGHAPEFAQAIEVFHQDDRKMVIETIAHARETGEDYRFTARIVRPDGQIRHVESRGLPEPGKDGTIVALFGVLADRTDEVMLRNELLAARDEAETAMRTKSTFLANMSHEIRTPMNGVIGFADLLLRSDLTLEQRSQIQLIAESGRAMTLLLNDILDLSKIEAGELSVNEEVVDLANLARHAARVVEPAAKEKAIALDLEIADDLPGTIFGDGLRLRQILLNLLGNAVKFTDHGYILMSVSQVGDMLEFVVRDTGLGIPADRQASIFEDFVRVSGPEMAERGGTGLGLAISARLAGLMGGTLTVESELGSGSTFALKIPLFAANQPATGHKFTAQTELTSPKLSGRVLLAEDYDINQMLISAMAEQAGIALDIAEDGAAAVRMVQAAKTDCDPYALILMDVQMPVMDGLHATKELRRRGFAPADLPIIALTANAFPEDIENCLAAGMQAHCSKPLSMDRFEQILCRWLGPDEAPSLAEVAA